MRDKIFISYSHSDANYLSRLKIHLKAFERLWKIQVWSDTKIKPWDKWKDEIKKWLDQAGVVILLVSADFLASEFIMTNELPDILKWYESNWLKIIPVILKPCSFNEHEILSSFQSINSPSNSIIEMEEWNREKTWYELARQAKEYITEKIKEDDDEDLLEELLWDDFKPWSIKRWEWYPEFLQSEVINPDLIEEYYIYSYMHIDYLSFMPLAEDYYFNQFEGYDEIIDRVKKKIKEFWWEWDGDIQLLWFPPFTWVWVNDTFWVLTFFVKQENNWEAFICSPVPLTFWRLLEQQWRS